MRETHREINEAGGSSISLAVEVALRTEVFPNDTLFPSFSSMGRNDQPFNLTSNVGMVVDEIHTSVADVAHDKIVNDIIGIQNGQPHKKREPRRYVSAHFATQSVGELRQPVKRARKKKPKSEEAVGAFCPPVSQSKASYDAGTTIPIGSGEKRVRKRQKTQDQGKEQNHKRSEGFDLANNVNDLSEVHATRVYFGLNIDELSSDSDLTDVPTDIGPDPFVSAVPRNGNNKRELVAVKQPKQKSKHIPKTSPYFPHRHKYRASFLSTLPFPPLQDERFGLMQERLADQPFRLLLATIFLNKTPGARAMPIFFKLLSLYPEPEDLAAAKVEDITPIIWELGFQNQRARKCVGLAKGWVERPPQWGKRYRKKDYPAKGSGRSLKDGEVYDDETQEDAPPAGHAWEISHLPGLGPYSHDSWRIFCRDKLRGLANSWNGEGHICEITPSLKPSEEREGKKEGNDDDGSFEPEWRRVLPTDKELRAYLTWMWLKQGWVWNKETGARTKASEELMRMASGDGNVIIEEREKEILMIKTLESKVTGTPGRDGRIVNVNDSGSNTAGSEQTIQNMEFRVEQPAGEFLPKTPGGFGKRSRRIK